MGEQDPEELSECLLNPETRRIEQVAVNDEKAAEELFDILYGTSVPPRRAYLLKHAEEAND